MTMEILISDNWLREFLKTKASHRDIAKMLSLCGPSVEKVSKLNADFQYLIEVTTNRVDSLSVYGIAREASAILPRFGIKARLIPLKTTSGYKFSKEVDFLKTEVDSHLCPRFTVVLIKDVKIGSSPDWMVKRLNLVGVRPINNVVDISNYIMHELGQPVHTFDYDKIAGQKMILRNSRQGETIVTLDGKKHLLPGEDIVIEDGGGSLIDLCGIMGGTNSAVDEKTKNVLLFVQTYNPVNIRKTCIATSQRSEASAIFEKSPDPELVTYGMLRAIDLLEKLFAGVPEKHILDIYPKPYKVKTLSINYNFINSFLGTKIKKSEISEMLTPLGFELSRQGNNLLVKVPSFRAKDINIPQDIVEEIARIYGYHNLPSQIMEGALPEPGYDSPFLFETGVKNILKSLGATEVYTSSLVPREWTEEKALKLRNPLGDDSEYLRTSLKASLVNAAKENSGQKEPFHLFEMANIYIPRKDDLPEEGMTLAGIFSNQNYRKAKGTVEALLEQLNIKFDIKAEDAKGFYPSQRLTIISAKDYLGEFGILEESGFIYYQFKTEKLRKQQKAYKTYKPIPKYPAQIEDITFKVPEKTKIGEVIQAISNLQFTIYKVELKDIYKDSYTFRIWYQHPDKTLINKEVEEIRNKIIKSVKEKFGGVVK